MGGLGAGIYETDDVYRDYEDLKKKGVEFDTPPVERPYGIESVAKDPFGNWLRITQPKPR